MECIPFVRRISNLRQTMIRHESPGKFNKKVFTAEANRGSSQNQKNNKKRLSATGRRASYESDNTEEVTCSSESAASSSSASDYERQTDMSREMAMSQSFHQRRNVISPSVSYSDQVRKLWIFHTEQNWFPRFSIVEEAKLENFEFFHFIFIPYKPFKFARHQTFQRTRLNVSYFPKVGKLSLQHIRKS